MSTTTPIHPRSATTKVIPTLRRGGVQVQVRHSRYFGYQFPELYPYRRKSQRTSLLPIAPRGGETTVTLTFPNGGTYTGTAKCSIKDLFNRRVGIALALSRALADRKQVLELDAWYDKVDPAPSKGVVAQPNHESLDNYAPPYLPAFEGDPDALSFDHHPPIHSYD